MIQTCLIHNNQNLRATRASSSWPNWTSWRVSLQPTVLKCCRGGSHSSWLLETSQELLTPALESLLSLGLKLALMTSKSLTHPWISASHQRYIYYCSAWVRFTNIFFKVHIVFEHIPEFLSMVNTEAVSAKG